MWKGWHILIFWYHVLEWGTRSGHHVQLTHSPILTDRKQRNRWLYLSERSLSCSPTLRHCSEKVSIKLRTQRTEETSTTPVFYEEAFSLKKTNKPNNMTGTLFFVICPLLAYAGIWWCDEKECMGKHHIISVQTTAGSVWYPNERTVSSASTSWAPCLWRYNHVDAFDWFLS